MNTFAERIGSILWALALSMLLCACGGGGGSGGSSTPTPTPVAPAPTAAQITLAASQTSVKSDNSDSSTITVTAVSASNAAVSGITVTFSVDSGFLSVGSATTDATGKATVTFSAGADPTSRTATISAMTGTLTSQIPVRIAGSTLTATTTTSSLVVGSASTTLTVVAKNVAGAALPGRTIAVAQSGSGSVVLGATSGTTDVNGTFTTTVAPNTSGAVQLTITGIGETRTVSLSVTGASTAFQITTPAAGAPTAATVGSPVTVSVLAPSPSTRVTFATTLGTWVATSGAVISGSGTSVITLRPLPNGTASAQLTAPSAGVASIQVFDPDRQASANDSRTVSVTASCGSATTVTVQSTPSVVAPSVGGTTNLATVLATVTDANANPVGNCPVAFSVVSGTGTGGGETISPTVVLTASTPGAGVGLGQASTSFSSGSLPSGANGIKVRATVVQPGSSTTIATGQSQQGPDATIVIGGVAGSVTIGQSTTLQDSASSTTYVLPMSVLVADSNGNPVANATVSLSTWPIAFNVGAALCGGTTSAGDLNFPGTFYYNEDINENLVRDTTNGESSPGLRTPYPLQYRGSPVTTSFRTTSGPLVPPNSAAGTIPATVTTGANGVATFNLTYLKSNAGYVVDRIRARTIVQGTETIGEVQLRLGYLAVDVGSPCSLAPSPFL